MQFQSQRIMSHESKKDHERSYGRGDRRNSRPDFQRQNSGPGQTRDGRKTHQGSKLEQFRNRANSQPRKSGAPTKLVGI